MRIRELLTEDYQMEYESDLTNILIGAKGHGVTEIPTNAIVQQLQKMGYSVSVDSLISSLENNPVVTNASPESIRLTGGEDTEFSDNQEDSADQVSGMAQDAAQKSMK